MDQLLPLIARVAATGLVLIAPFAVSAQDQSTEVSRSESAFVNQAPVEDASSKVYFPDQITPEFVAVSRARAEAERQRKLQEMREAKAGSDVAQVSQTGERGRDVDQLSDGGSSDALAQLSPAEREVLIDAVEGTDICDRQDQIPAIRELCEGRLETRSAEFAQNRRGATAAEAILGESLDSDRLATLESAIARLARNSPDSTDGVSDSVIASVAFTNQNLANNQQPQDSDPVDDLSPETQALVGAIVQQLGGP